MHSPSAELIQALVELKRRNPRFGCPRIAQQINKAFGINIDKDVVQRILATHYRPDPGDGGPSWLTFLGHTKDSLWSIDLFRCESILLKSHWVFVVMDHVYMPHHRIWRPCRRCVRCRFVSDVQRCHFIPRRSEIPQL